VLKIQTILPLRQERRRLAGESQAAALFTRAKVIAPAALQTARLAVCQTCQYNQAGVCKQCCGGVPITTLVNLQASRCARQKWRA
jgi:hypothetical protein